MLPFVYRDQILHNRDERLLSSNLPAKVNKKHILTQSRIIGFGFDWKTEACFHIKAKKHNKTLLLDGGHWLFAHLIRIACFDFSFLTI